MEFDSGLDGFGWIVNAVVGDGEPLVGNVVLVGELLVEGVVLIFGELLVGDVVLVVGNYWLRMQCLF